MKNTTSAIDVLQGAVSKAFDRAGNIAGDSSDPELKIYSWLKPEDFDKMLQEFGPDNVVNYIKAMEAKKMRRKK